MSLKDILSPRKLAAAAALTSALSFDPEAALGQGRIIIGGGVRTRRGGGNVVIDMPLPRRQPQQAPPVGGGVPPQGGYPQRYPNQQGPGAAHPELDRRPTARVPVNVEPPVGGTAPIRYVSDDKNTLMIGYNPQYMGKEVTAMSACDGLLIKDDFSSVRIPQSQVVNAMRMHKPSCVVVYGDGNPNTTTPQQIDEMTGGSAQIVVNVPVGKRGAFPKDSRGGDVSTGGGSYNPGTWMETTGLKNGYDYANVYVKDQGTGRWVNAGQYTLDHVSDPKKLPVMADFERAAIKNLGEDKYRNLVCRAVVNNPSLTNDEAMDRIDAKPEFKKWWTATEKANGEGKACPGFSPLKGEDFLGGAPRASLQQEFKQQPVAARVTDGARGALIASRR